jgi:hypothetical protein
LLKLAAQARTEYDDRLLKVAPKLELDRVDLPEYLLVGTSYLAGLQHAAELRLLADRRVSFAAEVQLRVLLEFLALVAFVLGKETDDPVGTPRQRAICLSLARSREEFQMVNAAAALGKTSKDQVAVVAERVSIYSRLHDEDGCPYVEDVKLWGCREGDGQPCLHRSQWPCRQDPPRPRTIVQSTTNRLAVRLKRHGLPDLYMTSSMMIHLGLLDRLTAMPGAVDIPRDANYRERAGRLAMGLTLYGRALGWILELYSADSAKELGAWFGRLCDHPTMKAAMVGELDTVNGT